MDSIGSHAAKKVPNPPIFTERQYPFKAVHQTVLPLDAHQVVVTIPTHLLAGNRKNLESWIIDPPLIAAATSYRKLLMFVAFMAAQSIGNNMSTANSPCHMVMESINEFVDERPTINVAAWRAVYLFSSTAMENIQNTIAEFFISNFRFVRKDPGFEKAVKAIPEDLRGFTLDDYKCAVRQYLTTANAVITDDQNDNVKELNAGDLLTSPMSPYSLTSVFNMITSNNIIAMSRKPIQPVQRDPTAYVEFVPIPEDPNRTTPRMCFPLPDAAWYYTPRQLVYVDFFNHLLPERMEMLDVQQKETILALRSAFPGLTAATIANSGVARFMSARNVQTMVSEQSANGNILLKFFTPYNGLKDELKEDWFKTLIAANCSGPTDPRYYELRRKWQLGGIARFQSVWDPNRPDLSVANIGVIKFEREKVTSNPNIARFQWKIDNSVSLAGNQLIRMYIELERIADVVFVHSETVHCWMSFRQAAWGDSGRLHSHILLTGDPQKGKSRAFTTASKMCVEGTVWELTNMTEKTLTAAQYDLVDRALVCHEAPPGMLGIDNKDKGTVGFLEQMIKDMLTNCKISYQELVFRNDQFGNRMERVTVSRVIQATNTLSLSLNNCIDQIRDASFSRMDTMAVTGDDRKDGVKIVGKIAFDSNDVAVKQANDAFYFRAQLSHYLYFKTEKLIQSNLLCDANMTLASVYFLIALAKWEEMGVNTLDPRPFDRMLGKARVLTINYAIEQVFFNYRHPVYGKPITDEMFMYLEEYLVCTEDIAWMTLGLCRDSYIPKPYMQFLEAIQGLQKNAQYFTEAMDVFDETVNPHYLQFNGNETDLAHAIHSYHKTKAVAADDLKRIIRSLRQSSVKVKEGAENETTMNAITSTRSGSRDRQERLLIAVSLFTIQFKDLVVEAIKASWHRHTRTRLYEGTEWETDRYIVTGETVPGYPYLLQKIKVERPERYLCIANENAIRRLTSYVEIEAGQAELLARAQEVNMDELLQDRFRMALDNVKKADSYIVNEDFEELCFRRHAELLGISPETNASVFSSYPAFSERGYSEFMTANRKLVPTTRDYPDGYMTVGKAIHACQTLSLEEARERLGTQKETYKKRGKETKAIKQLRDAAFSKVGAHCPVTFGVGTIVTADGPNVSNSLDALETEVRPQQVPFKTSDRQFEDTGKRPKNIPVIVLDTRDMFKERVRIRHKPTGNEEPADGERGLLDINL